jgi:8-oxo-dGTP pyrophosphatase MutT (NUDIX family)
MSEIRPAQIELSAGGVIYRHRDGGATEVLLMKDSYGNWGFPKGHVEGEETSAEAALRECREETGLDRLHVVGSIGTTDWYFRAANGLVHKFCDYFLVKAEADATARPQQGEGIQACSWLKPEDALRQVTYANARTVLEVGLELERRGDQDGQPGGREP